MDFFCFYLQASVHDPLRHGERIDAAFAPPLIARFGGNVSADVLCVLSGILHYHMIFLTQCMLQLA